MELREQLFTNAVKAQEAQHAYELRCKALEEERQLMRLQGVESFILSRLERASESGLFFVLLSVEEEFEVEYASNEHLEEDDVIEYCEKHSLDYCGTKNDDWGMPCYAIWFGEKGKECFTTC